MFACFSGFSQSDYYYYKGEKIYLTPTYQYVNIVTANSFDETQLTNNNNVLPFTLRTENTIRDGEYKKNAKLEFIIPPTNQTDYNQKLSELKSLNNIESVYPYYIYNGHPFGASNKILVKLNQTNDTTHLQTIASQKSLDIIKQLDLMPLWYIVTCNENTIESPIEMAAYLYETGLFAEADPTFTERFITPTSEASNTSPAPMTLEFCENYVYDEVVKANQWNFFNNPDAELADINVCGAWEAGYLGQGVTVTVIDTGIWAGLFDLPVSINDVTDPADAMEEDFYYISTNVPQHGTHVAGIIGALHDGAGGGEGQMGGIAPQSNLKYVATQLGISLDVTSIITGINWANTLGSKVINMSFENGTNATSGAFADKLEQAANQWNMVLVAGAGNEEMAAISSPANHPQVLAVGGSTFTGERWSGSHYGAELDVIAPAEAVYTNAFENGINDNFWGTSCATPHVSGIAALILSNNQNIKSEGVRNIIRRTAQKTIDVDYPYNDWEDISIGSRNDYLGYGIPDATESVLVAQEFETGVVNNEPILDLHMRNSLRDYGKEPDNVTKHANNVLWNSPDIWVRNDITTDLYGNDGEIVSGSMTTNELYLDTDGDGIDDLGNVWINAKNNNNIAWKNIQVINTKPNPKPAGIILTNLSNESKEYTLEFKLEDNIKGSAIFEEAEVNIQMDTDLYQDWSNSGAVTTNFETTNQHFKVTEDDAIIDNISLEAGEIKVLQISFNFLADELTNKKEFVYHFIQREKVTQDIVSGKTFYIKKGEAVSFDANAGDDKEIDKNQSVTLSAESINEPATYNWYDPEGNLIYTGMNFTLSPELTKQYTLEIIKDADGVKDYDEVTVEVNPFVFGIMSPNPATNEVSISYIAEDASSAYFMFTEQSTGNAYNYILNTEEYQKTIDVTTYPTGIYLVSLVCNGNLIETQQLLIN